MRLLRLEPESPVKESKVREPSNGFGVEEGKELRPWPFGEDKLCTKVNLGSKRNLETVV